MGDRVKGTFLGALDDGGERVVDEELRGWAIKGIPLKRYRVTAAAKKVTKRGEGSVPMVKDVRTQNRELAYTKGNSRKAGRLVHHRGLKNRPDHQIPGGTKHEGKKK